MFVLGIDTSCDDTGIAVIKAGSQDLSTIVAENVSSQVDLHLPYGGVVPELAARSHMQNLPLVLEHTLKEAEISLSDLSAIGVTRGPGLKGCLLMGVSFAKGLALARNIPLLGINHIEGHVLAAQLDNPELSFPFLALVVSGGHTEIIIAHELGSYELVARTIDDAAGEAFDKSAHLLGFPYPGGPALARLADECSGSSFNLPKVMREAEGFSFSGLKTAIALLIKKEQEQLDRVRAELAHAIQQAIIDALEFKVKKALEETGLKRLAVTGGVSANVALRTRLTALNACSVYFPKMSHSIDNGAMIAYTALKRFQNGERHNLELDVLSRWPLEELS